MSKKIDELNRTLDFQRNPVGASLKQLASISDSFNKLSDTPVRPMSERLATLLRNKDEATFNELANIADSLELISDRGNFKGDQGDQGLQGEPGLDGMDGKDGVDGSDGLQGDPGANGKDGRDGVDGKPGKDGERGPAGRDGIHGADGQDGKDGRDGLDGQDGSPDTPEQIRDKLLELKDDKRLDKSAIKGLDKTVGQDDLDRAVSILDQRTSFLINKINNLPPSGGSGTVTDVSVVTANGLSGTVANSTTTPAITLDISGLDATKIADGTVTSAEFQYLGGVTSDIQTQLGNKQALDATLTALAGLTIAADSLTIGTGTDAFSQTTFAANTFPARASTGSLAAKTITDYALTILDDVDASTARATLGLTIGTNVQAYDADLTTWAGITPGTGVGTALAVNTGSAGAVVVNGGALGTPSSGTLTNATGLPAASVVAGTLGTGAYTMDTSLTVPAINGSTAANGDITINGTSNATKASSYVVLQPTGGNVGIGTTTPDNKLAVLGGIGTGMSFYNTAAPARANFHLTAGIVGYTHNALALSENYDGVEYYHLTTFAKNLYLGGKSNVVSPASVTILNGQGKTDILKVNSTSPFVIQAGGNVGIGTTAPAAAFELASGGLYVSNYGSGVSVPGGGSIGMYLRGATSTSPFGFSAAGTGNISTTAPLFYYSWVGASATKLGFSSYDASAIKDYIAFDYATGNFEVKAPAIEATSSTTIGTTTLADKFGNAYLTNGADIYPDNDVYGLWDRFINYGFTPDEHWGQNADELTWTGWATYTGFVTPASITTTRSSYSVAHNDGVKSAFRYRSAATGADIFLRARASVTFLNTGGVMIDDGTDTGDGNGANNFYRVYIKQTALGGAFQVFEEYRTGGGAVTTNTGPTISYGEFSGIGLLTQGTRWTSWTAAPFTFGEAQSDVQFTGGTAAMSWTPARVGLYAKFSATDFGRRAVWDWYDESTS